MRVAIRADASDRIGSGHLMRCLALADALSAAGAGVHFLSRALPAALAAQVADRGHSLTELPADDDARATRAALAALGAAPDWLVVDHYALDRNWERALRAWTGQLLAIDDLGREHEADLLLDQNLVAPGEERYAGRLPASCRALLGEDYVLLAPAYLARASGRAPRRGRARCLLAFFGGGEHDAPALAFLDALASLEDASLQAQLVLPASAGEEVRRRAGADARVRVHGPLPDLAELMSQCDLAIGAAGSASWERLYLGLPSLVLSLAENQVPVARELARRGLARWLGGAEGDVAARIAEGLRDALAIADLESWSRRCLDTVDGLGAARVVAAMQQGLALAPRSRRVDAGDEARLLEWANDPGTRRHAFNPGQIDPATHRAWLQRRLADPGCRFFIVEQEGRGIGSVRFQREPEGWEVHFSLAPGARGRGLGARLLRAGLDALRAANIEGEARVFGRVQEENLPSRKVFEALEFRGESTSAGPLVFRSRL
jgi:UDP-2,4-diacetamido-2,4,6-trideoxy-beta-L-altropyranose hydrolase